jgi:hypothetical protein
MTGRPVLLFLSSCYTRMRWLIVKTIILCNMKWKTLLMKNDLFAKDTNVENIESKDINVEG